MLYCLGGIHKLYSWQISRMINDDTVVQRFCYLFLLYCLGGIHKLYSWQISRMINIAASSAKLGINIPELDWGF